MKRFLALVVAVLLAGSSVIGGRRSAGRVSGCPEASFDMYARECADCHSLWPDENQYRECPQCEKQTRYVAKRPMTGRAASARVSAIVFERKYQARERDRKARGELSPEDLGRLDAARDLEEIRALEGLL